MTETTPDRELRERLELAQRLKGNKVRFRHWATGTGIRCTKINHDGTVELHGMSGGFHPSLFEIDEVSAVPLAGKVN